MKLKRLLSIILCLCMFASLFSVSALAEDVPVFEPIGEIPEEPIVDEPEEPIVDEPEEPIADEPEEPIVDDPEEPIVDEPEEPIADEPEEPIADEPKEPVPDKTKGNSVKVGYSLGDPAPIATGEFNAYLASYSGVYDGTNHLGRVSLFIEDTDGNNVKSSFSWTRADLMQDVGDYPIVITGNEGTDYAGKSVTLTYSVTPASISVSANNASKTYGAADPALTYTVDPAYSAFVTGAPARDAGENAGSYTIAQGSIASNSANYVISFTAGTFTINAKAVSPVAAVSPASIAYTGTEIYPTVTVYTDSSKAAVIDASEYSVSYSNNTNVGTAGFTVSDAAGGNYSFSDITGSFSIVKADPVYTAPSAIPGLKYNGSNQQLVNPGSVQSAGCTLVYSNTQYGTYTGSTPMGNKAGTYEVWYKVIGNANYNDVPAQKLNVTISSYTAGDRVADMIRGLFWLPGGQVDPGNAHQRSEVLKVWNAYNNLSYWEKQKVPADLYNWLYNLVSNTDYAIIAGNGSIWYKGRSSGISFTAIDTAGKFAGVRVDGKLIDSSNYYYSGQAETCVVTLKPSYLTNLSFGKHDITICFWNGYANGYFNIVESSGSPPTGDTANFPLWGSMMFLSLMGIGAAAVIMFKRKKNEE